MNNNFIEREEALTRSPTFPNDSIDLNLSPQMMQMHMEDVRKTESMTTTEWTDEKHSMYLKSMEATFVNQLYDSKNMLASFSLKGTSYDPDTTSSQFKVLRGGRWQNISFEKENPQTGRINQCRDLTTNPWIRHYRSSSKQQIIVAPSLQESVNSISQVVDLDQKKGISSNKSGHLHLFGSHACHQDMLSNDTEMSDQNFVGEEVEGEKEHKRRNLKRQKALIIDAKGNDQMVPASKSSCIGDVPNKNGVSATENMRGYQECKRR